MVNTMNDNKKMPAGNLARYVPAILFLAFVFGMAIWFLFAPKKDYSSSEKRYLQEFPDTSVDSIASGGFGTDFESFFADHFPGRNMWVGFNSYYNLAIGNNGADGVYNCSDDYLINKPVSESENYIERNIGVISEFKKKTGKPMTVLLAPSTGYVASDVLPLIHNKYNDNKYIDSAITTFAESGIDFVDLREPFKNAYEIGNQIYYKTDHHWTTRGAFIAYTELCKKLRLEPVSEEKFFKEAHGGFYGTTYSTSGFWFTPPDEIEIWKDPELTAQVKITEGGNTSDFDSLYFYDHLEEDDKYPVFIDGNHALTEIINNNAKGGTAVVIKDSFSHSIAPFLAENYKKLILVDLRYFKNSVSDLVKNENPDQLLCIYGIDNLATDTDLAWLQ